MLDNSILVAAHPDDEALWFSSILGKTNKIIICFSRVASRPDCTEGRRKCIASHPLKNLSCLNITSSEVSEGADWNNPILTRYGLEISKPGFSDQRYKNSHEELKKSLQQRLLGYQNVITHNPWGDYGHVEHIQVYRVIKELQAEFEFNIWFSNYCSNRSFPLYLKYTSSLRFNFIALPTNKPMGMKLMHLYKKHNCWTWYDNVKWFNEECFSPDPLRPTTVSPQKRIFPLNVVKMKPLTG